jgi:hypothetical protein
MNRDLIEKRQAAKIGKSLAPGLKYLRRLGRIALALLLVVLLPAFAHSQSPKITRENYGKIQLGMTKQQVQHILGPGNERAQGGGVIAVAWEDTAGSRTTVVNATFRDGVLATKEIQEQDAGITGAIVGTGGILICGSGVLLVLVCLLPTIIALARGHPDTVPITIVSFVFGWSCIGWWIAFIWAVKAFPRTAGGHARDY